MLYPHYPSICLLIYFILGYMNALSHFLVKLLVYFKQDSRTIYCSHGKTFEFSGLQKCQQAKSPYSEEPSRSRASTKHSETSPRGPGEPDPMLSTHTQLTGTIATPPVCCPHCSKQYSSKVRGRLGLPGNQGPGLGKHDLRQLLGRVL